MSVSLRKKRAVGKARRKSPAKRKAPVAKRPRAKAKPAVRLWRRSKPRKPKAQRSPASVANIYHPGPLIDDEGALNAGVERLTRLDPELVGKLIAAGGRPPLRRREPGFAGLVWIIVSQQVSTASANAIFKRVEARFTPLDAASLLAADDVALRACGLSSAKMRALRAVADAIEQRRLDLPGLALLAAEEAHRALVAVKGIGPWTADIFLLFCLGHPDAFPAGDLALQEAARLALGLEARPDARALARIAERWRPLRGVAARLLWAYYRAARQGRQDMALAGA
jgi:DNA-3-methyladenine glycosylase II